MRWVTQYFFIWKFIIIWWQSFGLIVLIVTIIYDWISHRTSFYLYKLTIGVLLKLILVVILMIITISYKSSVCTNSFKQTTLQYRYLLFIWLYLFTFLLFDFLGFGFGVGIFMFSLYHCALGWSLGFVIDYLVFKQFVSFGTTSLLDFIIVFVSTSSRLFSLRIRLLMNVMVGHVLIIMCVSISNFYVSSLVLTVLILFELFVLVLQSFIYSKIVMDHVNKSLV